MGFAPRALLVGNGGPVCFRFSFGVGGRFADGSVVWWVGVVGFVVPRAALWL